MSKQLGYFADKIIKINQGASREPVEMLFEWETKTHLVGMELPKNNMPDGTDIYMHPKNKAYCISPGQFDVDTIIKIVNEVRAQCDQSDHVAIDRMLRRLTIASERTNARKEANKPQMKMKMRVRKKKFTVNAENTNAERSLLHSYRRITESSSSNDLSS